MNEQDELTAADVRVAVVDAIAELPAEMRETVDGVLGQIRSEEPLDLAMLAEDLQTTPSDAEQRVQQVVVRLEDLFRERPLIEHWRGEIIPETQPLRPSNLLIFFASLHHD